MERGYGKVLTIFLIIAIILIIGILGFFAFRIFKAGNTTKKAKEAVSEFDENTPTFQDNNNNQTNTNQNNNEENSNNTSLEDIMNSIDNNNNSDTSNQQSKKKDTYFNGYRVIGTITIPSIDLEYPILEEVSSGALDTAIVAIYPNNAEEKINQHGNLVLSGHNYKNGTFFSNIKNLKTGSKIYIKNTAGVKLTYQVYNSYETTDSDSEYTRRDTEGNIELSLTTCTDQSGRRTIVWARAVE